MDTEILCMKECLCRREGVCLRVSVCEPREYRKVNRKSHGILQILIKMIFIIVITITISITLLLQRAEPIIIIIF